MGAVKDFGLGTVKNTLGNGFTGFKVGAGIVLLATVGVGFLGVAAVGAMFAGTAPLWASIVGGVIGGGAGFGISGGAVGLATSIGAAFGFITGGVKGVREGQKAENMDLAVQGAGKTQELQQKQQINKALKYQIANPLANKSDTHFQTMHASGQGQQQSAGMRMGGS